MDLPFLHIVDPTAREVQQRGVMTVGLLGSRYTMAGSYFVGRLRERYGMNVLVAEGEHQENVHAALYGELAKGIFLPATREKFKAAITDLVRRGAQAVIADTPVRRSSRSPGITAHRAVFGDGPIEGKGPSHR